MNYKGLAWFSGGVTSAIAILETIQRGFKVEIYYMETGQHHIDHERFIREMERVYGQKIHILRNKKYSSPIDVCLKDKYVNGPAGARCTLKLKKDLRFAIEKITDWDFQIFGFENSPKEINRAVRFEEQYPEAKAVFPLIELGIDKPKAMQMLQNLGVELPAMYKLGYSNSNCIGCIKGGKGYWNKIRVDFPEIFEKTAKMERAINRSCLKGQFLDELDPTEGRHTDITLPECGVVCPVELDGLEVTSDISRIKNRLFNFEDLRF